MASASLEELKQLVLSGLAQDHHIQLLKAGRQYFDEPTVSEPYPTLLICPQSFQEAKHSHGEPHYHECKGNTDIAPWNHMCEKCGHCWTQLDQKVLVLQARSLEQKGTVGSQTIPSPGTTESEGLSSDSMNPLNEQITSSSAIEQSTESLARESN